MYETEKNSKSSHCWAEGLIYELSGCTGISVKSSCLQWCPRSMRLKTSLNMKESVGMMQIYQSSAAHCSTTGVLI